MSTYLTVVVPLALEDRFTAWLGPVEERDHLVVEIPAAQARLHHVARAASRDLVAGSPAGPAAQDGSPAGPAAQDRSWGAGPVRMPRHGLTLFRGYAQDPDGTALVFGAGGLADWRRETAGSPAAGTGDLTSGLRSGSASVTTSGPGAGTTDALQSPLGRGHGWDGCHLLVGAGPHGLTATTDFFRQLPLLYTAGAGLVAISDSWALLVDLRSALGLPVSVDTTAALASAWSNTMVNHPLSATTLCHEVRMLPPAAQLIVPFGAGGAVAPRTEQSPWPEVFSPDGEPWGAQVRSAAVRTASLAAAWAGCPGTSVRLALSGGVDSRLVLAATLMADPGSDVTVYNTTNLGRANQADADTVRALAERFGFPVGAGGRPAPKPVLEKYASPLSVWLLDSLGLNHQLALPSFRVGGDGFFTVSGHGAGVHKGAYGWRSIPALRSDLAASDPQLATAVAGPASELLREVGIDPDAGPHATEWHYLAVRNSIHGGRFAIQNMLGPRPLMQRQLVALAHAPEGSSAAPPAQIGPAWSRGAGNRSLTAAVLSVLDPRLAAAPYDQPAKSIAPATIETVLAAAGGPLDPAERHAVRTYGAPADVVNGPAAVFERWARERLDHHLAHAPDPVDDEAGIHRQVAALVDGGLRVARDAGLAEWLGPTARRARGSMAAGGPLSHARGDAGTLMAFLPLAGAGVSDPVPVRRAPEAEAPGRPEPAAIPAQRPSRDGASPLRRLARRAVRSARRFRGGR
ncbi:MAG: hypothetical protein QJR09_01510 [Micrococcus sp.]|nr:hypothetical protein [Micrococcus sp.]